MATAGGAGDAAGAAIARRRTILLGAAIAALLVGVVGIAVVTRPSGSTTASTIRPVTLASSAPIAARHAEPTPPTRPRASTSSSSVVTLPATTIPAPSSTRRTVDLITAPVPTVPPTAAPTTTTPTSILAPAVTVTLPPPPPPFGAAQIIWTAPRTLTIVAGSSATLNVRAYNPTERPVSLSHPLACTPRLDHSELCADQAQLIPARGSASATYVIDATGFDAGSYTLTIEGVLTVRVTVS